MSTPRIQLLPPGVAERIAAGEVIERPASVVKELMENSIDAGATEIAVLLEEGGKALIEVLDNGHGMPPEDLRLCLERHATSKLSTLEDLEKIQTLGFRGEALPSIAAVSDLHLLSRAQNAETAYELSLSSLGRPVGPNPKTFGHFMNTSHGTRIQARGLFSQVPARLKFLKSQGAEVSQVREWTERLAMAHPKIGFRVISDGRPILTLRSQEETARVRAVLSDGEDYPIVSATNDLGFRDRTEGSLHIRAHWLQGLSAPQAKRLIQVVNGRAVRDRMLQQAVMAPFRQTLLPGQFPAIALYIEIDPSEIDVNVHPTKTEIRFLDNRKVFHAVQSVIESLISRNGATGFATREAPTQSPTTSSVRNTEAFTQWRAAQPEFKPMNFELTTIAQTQSETLPITEVPIPVMPLTRSQEIQLENNSPLRLLLRPDRYLGTLFNTYLLYDLGDEMALVDQHAAHERVRYEVLRRSRLNGMKITPQALLIPEATRFAVEKRALIEERLEWFNSSGFEAEIFGEDTLLFRAIPSGWGSENLRVRLKNVLERVISMSEPNATTQLSIDEILFESLASEACHSAVRAGDRLEREEAITLVQKLFECEHPWNCPHGRPTIVRIPEGRIEEWFQRRV